MKKQISELEISDLFSFSKKGAVHMVSEKRPIHIEYKSYSDGKIRVAYLDRDKPIFTREEWGNIYEAKHFRPWKETQILDYVKEIKFN